jgi:hypothetical protein
MGQEILDQILHFLQTVLATALALALIAFALKGLRRIYRGPIEPSEILENPDGNRDAHHGSDGVNVPYRDATGAPMDLGPLVPAQIHNSSGGLFALHEGCFIGCDPKWIHLGAYCTVSVAGGLVREFVRVQLDHQHGTLYVESRHTFQEMLHLISAPQHYVLSG